MFSWWELFDEESPDQIKRMLQFELAFCFQIMHNIIIYLFICHYENTPIQIYKKKIHRRKLKIFR